MLIAFAGAEKRRPRKKREYRCAHQNEEVRARDAEIVRLFNDGAPYLFIAEAVGQSRTAVFNRCRALGLPLRLPRWKSGQQ